MQHDKLPKKHTPKETTKLAEDAAKGLTPAGRQRQQKLLTPPVKNASKPKKG